MNTPEFNPDAPVRDTGLAALVIIARFHGISADSAQLRPVAEKMRTNALNPHDRRCALRPLSLSARVAEFTTVTAHICNTQ
ncbi:hypothetical protein [Paraburkholderia sp. BL6665CI2N2]|uniref:hypothetical protein n=1 Tax=Paraburkholderia sp. BL6665CI2N2 TaxID=1938806 RepID=UPI0010666C0C|nr:hypothetical protein [Paraburkholderia sp. BL6665CI2N2]